MKKRVRVILFTLAYAVSFSLGLACLLLGGNPNQPRFSLFCSVVGFGCLAVFVGLLFLSWLKAEDMGYTLEAVGLQLMVAFVLSLPLFELWKVVFKFLQKTF